MSYHIDDWIIHAIYGVGQVKSKIQKNLGGKKQTCLTVKTLTGVYYLPRYRWDSPLIRPLSSRYKIRKALSIIGQPAKPLSDNHRQRSKLTSKLVTEVSIYLKAEIIRDLYARKRSSKLDTGEMCLLENIIDQFLDEWSIVIGKDKEMLEEKLTRTLQTSFEKYKKRKPH